jgi:hypothetical protein
MPLMWPPWADRRASMRPVPAASLPLSPALNFSLQGVLERVDRMDRSVSALVALRHALGAAIRPLTNLFTYTTRSGIAAGLRRKGGLGFLPRSVSDEELFYQSLTLSGKTVYDVGSYEGIFSLFAARAVGEGGR